MISQVHPEFLKRIRDVRKDWKVALAEIREYGLAHPLDVLAPPNSPAQATTPSPKNAIDTVNNIEAWHYFRVIVIGSDVLSVQFICDKYPDGIVQTLTISKPNSIGGKELVPDQAAMKVCSEIFGERLDIKDTTAPTLTRYFRVNVPNSVGETNE